MIQVFVFMGLGILLGIAFRKGALFLKWIDKATLLAVFVLLFLMGVAIGANEQVMRELSHVGKSALLVTLGSVTGSILMAWVVYRIWIKMNK